MTRSFAQLLALIASLGATTACAQVRLLDHVGAADGESFHTNSSHGRALSRNGRWVVFRSNESSLVPGSSNGFAQIYVLDRETRTVEHISAGAGEPGNGHSLNATISHDGRYIAFYSESSNLVPGDTNNRADIFVRDRVAGSTARASVGSQGVQILGDSVHLAISGNGRVVAFSNDGTGITTDPGGLHMQLFVHDFDTGTTALVSRTPQGTRGTGISREPALSADGRYLAFESDANDLVPDDSNAQTDIFVLDRSDGTLTLVSRRADGGPANTGSYGPSISDDGGVIGFHAYGALVPEDTNGHIDGYAVDRNTMAMRRITLNHLQGQLGLGVSYAVISGDGQWVVFNSNSANVVPGVGSGFSQTFVRRIRDGLIRQVSINSNGVQPDNSSIFPAIGRNGALVGFASYASNLLPTVGAPTTQNAVYLAAPEIDEVNADGFD